MKILGIDPAYAKQNAYAISNCGYITDYGLFEAEEFRILLECRQPDVVIIEDVYFNERDNNPSVMKKLAQVTGILKFVCQENGIKVISVTAQSWMSSIKANNHRGLMAELIKNKGLYSTVKYNGAYYVRKNFKAVEGLFNDVGRAVNEMERLNSMETLHREVNNVSQQINPGAPAGGSDDYAA